MVMKDTNKKEIRTNHGQSEFQDTYFVMQAELTPFRMLRKIDLEIDSIKDALAHNDFATRKSQIKIKKLSKNDELEAIEIEELFYGLKKSKQLVDDALRRLSNFEDKRKELIQGVPEAYWDEGYEAAEAEHWVNYYSKRMALEIASHGRALPDTLEKVMSLPPELKQQVFKLKDGNAQELIALDVKD